jgi:hypothetical protein
VNSQAGKKLKAGTWSLTRFPACLDAPVVRFVGISHDLEHLAQRHDAGISFSVARPAGNEQGRRQVAVPPNPLLTAIV